MYMKIIKLYLKKIWLILTNESFYGYDTNEQKLSDVNLEIAKLKQNKYGIGV